MPTSADCANCGKASAALRYPHVDPDGNSSFTPYCSKPCQIADWSNHKTACQQSKQRTQLFQADALFKALALAFCEKGNFFSIQTVEVTDASINLYDGPPGLSPLGQDFTLFPHLNEYQKTAVISMAGVSLMTRALHWMAHFTLSGFGDITLRMVKIKESFVRVRQSRVKAHDPNGRPLHFLPNPIMTSHLIVSVQMKDGLEYIVDPLGCHIKSPTQHRPVCLWTSYRQVFVEEVVATCNLTPPEHARPNPTSRPDKLYVHKAMFEIQQMLPRNVIVAAIKKLKVGFEKDMADMVMRTRKLMAAASEAAKKKIQHPKFGRRNPHLLHQKEEFAQDGRARCGLLPSAQAKAEETVLQKLRRRYGPDQTLVEMVKQARSSETVDDLAEVGNRCQQHDLHEMLRRSLQMQAYGVFQ